jgi:hypothetical protein
LGITLSDLGAKAILGLHPAIRYVVQVGFDGSELKSVERLGITSLEPEEQTVRVLQQTALSRGIGESSNGFHGRVRCVVVLREKLTIIVFPLFDTTLVVTADPDFPLERTADLGRLLDEVQVEEICPPSEAVLGS